MVKSTGVLQTFAYLFIREVVNSFDDAFVKCSLACGFLLGNGNAVKW